MSCQSTRSAARGAAALIMLLVLCGIPRGALAAETTLTAHEEYISKYRATSDKPDERTKLVERFLAEAEAYIAAHPDGAEIVQAKLNKALAIGLYGQRHDEEADKLFTQIRADYPDSPLMPEVMYYHARLFLYAFDGKRPDEARAIQLQLVEKFPTSAKAPSALLGAAQSTWWHAKDAQGAGKLFKAVVEAYPDTQADIEARALLIEVAISQGDNLSAQRQIDQFLERFVKAPHVAPTDVWERLFTGSITDSCVRLMDWERATECLEAVLAHCQGLGAELQARRGLIRAAVESRDRGAAQPHIDAVLDRFSKSRDTASAEDWQTLLVNDVGRACIAIRDWPRANAALEAVLGAFPDTVADIEARALLIEVAVNQGDKLSAQRQIDQFLERFVKAPHVAPTDVWERLFTGSITDSCLRLMDRERATRCLSALLDRYEGARTELAARRGLIRVALKHGDPEGAKAELGLFDEALKKQAAQPWALEQELGAAGDLRYLSSPPNLVSFRGEAVGRLLAIVEKHPGTPEAAIALDGLISHYIFDEPDLNKARSLNLRLLRENPVEHARACAGNVRRMTTFWSANPLDDGDYYLLKVHRDEVRERAEFVAEQYSELKAPAKRRFIREVCSRVRSREAEKTIAEVVQHARARGDARLLKEALHLQGECYVTKWQPHEALCWITRILRENADLFSEQDRLHITDYRAVSLFYLNRYGEALPVLEELQQQVEELEAPAPDAVRSKAYCLYLQALACFLDGDYVRGKAGFEQVAKSYAGSRWAKRSAFYLDHINELLPLLVANTSGG